MIAKLGFHLKSSATASKKIPTVLNFSNLILCASSEIFLQVYPNVSSILPLITIATRDVFTSSYHEIHLRLLGKVRNNFSSKPKHKTRSKIYGHEISCETAKQQQEKQLCAIYYLLCNR